MWKQDGPDMLFCDGHAIYRIYRTGYYDDPLRIQIERYLEAHEGAVPLNWPIKANAPQLDR